MRVGYLSTHSPADPGAISGVPHAAWNALAGAGIDLVDLSAASARPMGNPANPSRGARNPARHAAHWVRGIGRWLTLRGQYGQTLAKVEARSRRAQARLDAAPPLDLVFSVCISSLLYTIRTDLPVVYASDTTGHLMNTTYPEYRARSEEYHRAADEIERTCLHKCRFFAPSSQPTARSAVEHYGMPPERVRVIEFGANVTPDDMPIDPAPPTRDHLELVLVAADPQRKRLDLCIEVAKELRARGWNAVLNFIGPRPSSREEDGVVDWAGPLQLSDPDDRQQHKEILRRSHWMLLPSTAEAFGIAPCEAAHFGRPSVVTDVGGLPTVVQHERTGMVVPVDAPASVYADAIERFSDDPARYEAMSQAALQRARDTLNWSVWAKRMKALFEEAVAGAGIYSA